MKHFNLLSSFLEQVEQSNYSQNKIKELASQYSVSDIHLQRIFKFMFGKPLGSYIRSRRLALSIGALLNSNLRILDIALEYGFDYEQTYIRAFKREYGISPGEYRRTRDILKIIPPITLCEKNRLDSGMIYGPEFVVVPSFYVVGLLHEIKFRDAETPNIVARKFEKVMADMPGVINSDVYIGLTRINDVSKAANFSYYLTSVQVENLKNVPNGYNGDYFNSSLCARFRYIGEHHYRDISWHKAKQMYETINYFTDNINQPYHSLRHEFYFERINLSKCDGAYCEMEWFTPVNKK